MQNKRTYTITFAFNFARNNTAELLNEADANKSKILDVIIIYFLFMKRNSFSIL